MPATICRYYRIAQPPWICTLDMTCAVRGYIHIYRSSICVKNHVRHIAVAACRSCRSESTELSQSYWYLMCLTATALNTRPPLPRRLVFRSPPLSQCLWRRSSFFSYPHLDTSPASQYPASSLSPSCESFSAPSNPHPLKLPCEGKETWAQSPRAM